MLILAVAIVAIAATAYVNWVAMREENAERELTRQKLVDHVKKLTSDKAYKKEYFYRLLHDEKFADRIIRDKLGFVGKNEIVFRFEDTRPVGIDSSEGPMTLPSGATSEPDAAALDNDIRNTVKAAASNQQESLLSRLLFWKNKTSDGKTESPKDTVNDATSPEVRIDMLEESARKNAEIAKAANVNSSKNNGSYKEIKINFDISKTAKNPSSLPASVDTDTSVISADEFMSAQKNSGELRDADTRASVTLKIGSGSSSSKPTRTNRDAPKVIRFRGN